MNMSVKPLSFSLYKLGLLVLSLLLILLTPLSAQAGRYEAKVTSLVLINADTDEAMYKIEDGEVLNLAELPTKNLNFKARVRRRARSVVFDYDNQSNFHTDNFKPFAFAGHDGDDFFAWTPTEGNHTIIATPYRRKNGNGSKGIPLVISFSVIDDAGSSPTPTPTATSTPETPPSQTPTPTPTPTPSQTPTFTPTPNPTPTPGSQGADWWKPSPGTSWQWQLSGSIDTSYDVQMYDIDLFDVPQSVIDKLHADGRIVICYFSAGSWEDWRPDASLFPSSVKGKSNGWPGEKWLDIRDLSTLAPIMEARLDLAVEKGCDGVEPDNIDGYTNNSGFNLKYNDQLLYNSWLAAAAHDRNLSIGLKNDLDQVHDLIDDFDWALNEQCFEYDECHLLLPFVQAGKAVFGVEYSGGLSSFCPDANAMDFDWLKKKLNLNAWQESCRELY